MTNNKPYTEEDVELVAAMIKAWDYRSHHAYQQTAKDILSAIAPRIEARVHNDIVVGLESLAERPFDNEPEFSMTLKLAEIVRGWIYHPTTG